MPEIKIKYTSRKLVVAAILFASSTLFFAFGATDFSGWAEFNKWIFGIYAAGNIGEHATKKDAT